ncbi:hypothetical protein [Streptomyces sp. NPDC006668]|uniref:hypothetical protein n=1 Tax=Streptomyces sp. NPDC006668 TaxID=3156903 RepID=UPI0033CEEFBD
MSDAFADDVERLHETAAELPRVLDSAVKGVATYAAAVAELVQNLDDRRTSLNEQAASLGMPRIPDLVTAAVPAGDAVRARLLAAARLGAGELAASLGTAAWEPATHTDAVSETETEAAESVGDAGRAATALLAWTHHEISDVSPTDLVAGVDLVRTSVLLAGLAVKLAREVMPDGESVTEWISSVGAAWALDGD